jgi:DNA polymerase-3 subunit delta'
MMPNLYPWQSETWQHLINRQKSGKLPHALLLTGQAGIGKLDLATYFAHTILCEQQSSQKQGPCGHCKGCALVTANNHPDFLNIAPEAEGKSINVDRVRNINQFLNLTRHTADLQIVIIAPADKMNKFAANSLLKTLEEPTSNTLLILITDNPGRLLPTIRSRCQTISCPSPSIESTTNWLSETLQREKLTLDSGKIEDVIRIANGSPLQALQFVQDKIVERHTQMLDQYAQIAENMIDPLIVALQWKEYDIKQSVNWLMSWTMEMIRLKLYREMTVNNRDGVDVKLQKLSQQLDLRALFDYIDKLTEFKRAIDSQLNQQLMLEDLLIAWSRNFYSR